MPKILANNGTDGDVCVVVSFDRLDFRFSCFCCSTSFHENDKLLLLPLSNLFTKKWDYQSIYGENVRNHYLPIGADMLLVAVYIAIRCGCELCIGCGRVLQVVLSHDETWFLRIPCHMICKLILCHLEYFWMTCGRRSGASNSTCASFAHDA